MRSLLLPIESKTIDEGIVLLLSLLISFIIAFALSVELLSTRLNKKSLALNRQHDTLFYALESNREWGIQQGLTQESCLFLASFPDDYPLRLKTKKIIGCTKKTGDITLHTVTEDLGVYGCHHWYRLTLLGEDAQTHQMLMQTVFTQPEGGLVNVSKNSGFNGIGVGQQSWRIVLT
jgi:hypothetical protein